MVRNPSSVLDRLGRSSFERSRPIDSSEKWSRSIGRFVEYSTAVDKAVTDRNLFYQVRFLLWKRGVAREVLPPEELGETPEGPWRVRRGSPPENRIYE